jgi:tetratricopeptide (TPR) repeat protein
MLAWGVPDLLVRFRYSRVVLIPLTAALLAACVVATNLQVRHWDDARALWEHAAAVDPGNAQIQYYLASYHVKNGQLDEAIACARNAIRLDPEVTKYRAALIHLLQKAGRDDEAIEETTKMVEVAKSQETN